MKVFYLALGLCFFSLAGAEPDYKAVNTEVEDEAEKGKKEDIDTIELSRDALIFPSDATADDLRKGSETGELTTARALREGSQDNLQAQLRADMAEWHRAKFAELREIDANTRKSVEEATRYADEDPGNGDFDVVHQLTEFDKMLHGPKHKKSDPAFAKSSSNSLNSAPDPSSQQGDPCQDGGGNSAGAQMAAMGAMYPDACNGTSYAEILDCTKETIKRINSEAKGASCNSTQAMQPTAEPDKTKLQNVSQAETSDIPFPSCATTPREAETVMADVSGLVGADRSSFEQNSLTRSSENSTFAYEATSETYVQVKTLPWYGKLLAWVLPSTKAYGDATSTLRGQSGNTVAQSEVDKQNFAKANADLASHGSIAPAQDWANKSSQMMEELNKLMETNKAETEKIQEHFKEIAELKMKPF